MLDCKGTRLLAFEYRYRDGGNFKATGSVLLEGSLSGCERLEIIGRLESSELFIAEQVGIPPLYHQLYAINGGPNADDHCWHEFDAFCAVDKVASASAWGTAEDLLSAFRKVKDWNEGLSPHYAAVR